MIKNDFKEFINLIAFISLFYFCLYEFYFHYQTNRRLEILERKEESLYRHYKELDWKYEYST